MPEYKVDRFQHCITLNVLGEIINKYIFQRHNRRPSLNCLEDCNGACCHDIIFQQISRQQREFFEASGAWFYDERLIRYCPFLEARRCRIYGDKKHRPKSCFAVIPGGKECLAFRKREGYKD